MIKFFRKIRQRLLTEKKFSKYLIYAIGEIVLVVIGILIALQINLWRNEKENQEKELNYLGNLKVLLEEHLVELDSNLDYIEKRMHSVDYVLSNVSASKNELITDSMIVHLNLMQWLGNIRLDTNLYQDMINTGSIGLISDKNLRLAIQNYFYLISAYRNSTKTNNDFYINNALKFYMRYLSMGHIIATPSKIDTEGKEPPKRELFELWDYGYNSPEMKEFENNLYFRRTDLDLEKVRNRDLSIKANNLHIVIAEYLRNFEQ